MCERAEALMKTSEMHPFKRVFTDTQSHILISGSD